MTMKKFGYIQLVSCSGDVLAQGQGYEHDIPYYCDKVWFVSDSHTVRFVEQSEFAQPNKFYRPLCCDDVVYIYSLEDSIHTVPVEPSRTLTTLKIKASQIDIRKFDPDGWNAFVGGEWVGTSEY